MRLGALERRLLSQLLQRQPIACDCSVKFDRQLASAIALPIGRCVREELVLHRAFYFRPRVARSRGRSTRLTATRLKALDADDRVFAALAGHRDPRSIEKYAKLEPATIESALKRLREPKGN